MESELNSEEVLPASFVSAMKTLFEIMDVNKSGTVRFTDIESRWQDDPRKGLPKGIVENLRKVTPSSGLLTFNQFCAGLKICLIKVRVEEQNSHDLILNNNKGNVQSQRSRPASVPITVMSSSDSESGSGMHKIGKNFELNQINEANNPVSKLDAKLSSGSQKSSSDGKPISRSVSSRPISSVNRPNTAMVKPNNAMAHRASSMPHLGEKNYTCPRPNESGPPLYVAPPPFIAPPPVKTSIHANNMNKNEKQTDEGCLSDSGIPSCPPSALNKSGIMTVLQNWRLGKLKDGKTGESMNLELKPETVNVILQQEPPGVPENIIEAPPKPPRGQGLTSDVTFRNMHGKKNQRKEPRRHTLANGIDYNMLKRMKQMEQEKDILVQGLEAVDRAKEWYVKQINLVQDKMRYVGRIGNYVEPSSDVYQERLNFQMARIFEVNQHLSALVESTNKGFPLHMNLALRQPTFSKLTAHSANNDGVIQRLKQQNVMLTEEVGKKGERITQLEREKAALIRELFQARSQNRRENDDNTLM